MKEIKDVNKKYNAFHNIRMTCKSTGNCDIVFCISLVDATSAEVEQHLAMGMKLVSAGQLSDALSHYHAAVGNVSSQDKI